MALPPPSQLPPALPPAPSRVTKKPERSKRNRAWHAPPSHIYLKNERKFSRRVGQWGVPSALLTPADWTGCMHSPNTHNGIQRTNITQVVGQIASDTYFFRTKRRDRRNRNFQRRVNYPGEQNEQVNRKNRTKEEKNGQCADRAKCASLRRNRDLCRLWRPGPGAVVGLT